MFSSHQQALLLPLQTFLWLVTQSSFVGRKECVTRRECLPRRRFPSCLSPLFQSESWCEAFHTEISFIHTQILVHLHVNKTEKSSLISTVSQLFLHGIVDLTASRFIFMAYRHFSVLIS